MQLYTSVKALFCQLHAALDGLTAEAYVAASRHLSGVTVGQHVRHVVELFTELNKGYYTGVVDYESRQRNYGLETDKDSAAEALRDVLVRLHKPDKPLLLRTDLSADDDDAFTVHSTYYRELLFNLEHTVHHMALIRVGIQELTHVQLPERFGVAAATLKHRQQCVR